MSGYSGPGTAAQFKFVDVPLPKGGDEEINKVRASTIQVWWWELTFTHANGFFAKPSPIQFGLELSSCNFGMVRTPRTFSPIHFVDFAIRKDATGFISLPQSTT